MLEIFERIGGNLDETDLFGFKGCDNFNDLYPLFESTHFNRYWILLKKRSNIVCCSGVAMKKDQREAEIGTLETDPNE